MKAIEEFEKFSIFFVNTNNLGAFVGLQVGKKDGTSFAELGKASAQRDSVRAGFFVGEPFQKECFDFRRDGMFEAFSFVVGFGPRKTNHVGEQHFGELMAQRHAFGDRATFAREIDVAIARDRDQIIAAHAFDRGSDRRWSDTEFLGQARADWRLAFFDEFPYRLEVVFLGNAGFCSHFGKDSRHFKRQKNNGSEDRPLQNHKGEQIASREHEDARSTLLS